MVARPSSPIPPPARPSSFPASRLLRWLRKPRSSPACLTTAITALGAPLTLLPALVDDSDTFPATAIAAPTLSLLPALVADADAIYAADADVTTGHGPMARKLLIALWRYVETGVVPAGAEIRAVA
jgi:hypothetical protein